MQKRGWQLQLPVRLSGVSPLFIFTTGMGGSGQKLEAEFTDYPYREGTVGMARTMDPNSADSQFFICFDGCGHLTGQYTVWGQVTTGMDVVKEINEGQPPADPDSIVSARLAE